MTRLSFHAVTGRAHAANGRHRSATGNGPARSFLVYRANVDRTGEPFDRDELAAVFGLDVDDPADAVAIEAAQDELVRQQAEHRRSRLRVVRDEP